MGRAKQIPLENQLSPETLEINHLLHDLWWKARQRRIVRREAAASREQALQTLSEVSEALADCFICLEETRKQLSPKGVA